MNPLFLQQAQNQNTNPTFVGPGTWNVIHTLAFKAKTKPQQQDFIKTLKIIIDYFPCEKCRGHAQDYLKNHPVEDYQNDNLGMFIWTWKFHNAVNFRTNPPKMQMSWELAYHLYAQLCGEDKTQTNNINNNDNKKNDATCSKECSASDSPPTSSQNVQHTQTKLKKIKKLTFKRN